MVASLSLGLSSFLTFASAVGAITPEEFAKYSEEGWAALLEAGYAQGHQQGSEDVVCQFFRLLTSAITSGAAHLAHPRGNEVPVEPKSWGWRYKNNDFGNECSPLGFQIGWIEGENVYLDPESTFGVVQELARKQGTSLPITPTTLWKRLDERGYLVSTETGRNTIRHMVAGKRHRVIHLSKALFGGDNGQMTSSEHAAEQSYNVSTSGPEEVDRELGNPERMVH
jgi:hypothetical protein